MTAIRPNGYIWSGLNSQNRNGASSFYGYGNLGTVRILTNSAGVITDEYDFSVFGVALSTQGTTQNQFRFAGLYFVLSENSSTLFVGSSPYLPLQSMYCSGEARRNSGQSGGGAPGYVPPRGTFMQVAMPSPIPPVVEPPVRLTIVQRGTAPARGGLVLGRTCISIAGAVYELCTYTPGHPSGVFTGIGQKIADKCVPIPEEEPEPNGKFPRVLLLYFCTTFHQGRVFTSTSL